MSKSSGRIAIDLSPATRQQTIEACRRRLEASNLHFGHGYPDAEAEAVALVDAAASTADPDGMLSAWLERRIVEREPLAYLLGQCQYWGLELDVAPGVMIPRSPIGGMIAEGLVPWLRSAPNHVLDLCCGTGCLGALAAHAFTDARVDLVDVDPLAVELARRNTAAFGDRVRVLAGDLFQPVERQRYDLILCNPPYVSTPEYETIPAEYAHEPRAGLESGTDGMDLWRRVVEALDDHLNPGGLLVGEVGNGATVFDASFPQCQPIWVELAWAEPQADGTFGVFVSGG